MSTYMHNEMNVGDIVTMGPPSGIFVPNKKDESKVVLISSGIGITPMYAYLRHLDKGCVKSIMHIDKSAEKHAYKSVFEESGIPSKIFYTSETGRPNLAEEAKGLVDEVGNDACYYICGPPMFMNTMKEELQNAGASKIEMEKFGTG